MGGRALRPDDGRVARGARSRNAVIEALLALIDEGDNEPTAQRIAERAGVSLRLVFHHFADMEQLFDLAAERVWASLAEQIDDVPIEGTLEERVQQLVDRRRTFFEAVGGTIRAARGLRRHSGVAQQRLAGMRTEHRDEVERIFAPELARVSAEDLPEVLGALDVAAGWGAWDALRTSAQLPPEQAGAIVRRLLSALAASL